MYIKEAKLAATIAGGVFLGGNLAQDLIYFPALRHVGLAAESQLKVFSRAFDNALKIFGSSALTSSACHAYLYYATRDNSYLAAALCSGAIFPFTFFVLLPDVAKLKAMNDGRENKDGMKPVFDRWCLKSSIRAFVVFAPSYAILLYKVFF